MPIHELAIRSDFEAVFHASPDPILLVGADGRIQDANVQAEIMFGWSCDELVGESVEVEMLVPQALRDGHRRYRSAYRRHPSSRPMGRGMELQAVGKDGVVFPVEISLGPSEDRSGTLLVISPMITFKGLLNANRRISDEIGTRVHRMRGPD